MAEWTCVCVRERFSNSSKCIWFRFVIQFKFILFATHFCRLYGIWSISRTLSGSMCEYEMFLFQFDAIVAKSSLPNWVLGSGNFDECEIYFPNFPFAKFEDGTEFYFDRILWRLTYFNVNQFRKKIQSLHKHPMTVWNWRESRNEKRWSEQRLPNYDSESAINPFKKFFEIVLAISSPKISKGSVRAGKVSVCAVCSAVAWLSSPLSLVWEGEFAFHTNRIMSHRQRRHFNLRFNSVKVFTTGKQERHSRFGHKLFRALRDKTNKETMTANGEVQCWCEEM